jgi:Uma2 family endonuclease
VCRQILQILLKRLNKMTTLQTATSFSPVLSSEDLKCWTVQEYYKIIELGILDPDERTELIAGQITLMAAKGTLHVLALQMLANIFQDQLHNTALTRTQDPILLDDFSEPEPDLVIVKGNMFDYALHHPSPEDIYLVVEVADSTLKKDCEVKEKIYAKANIADYWVVDLKNRQVHIFRDPMPSGYENHFVLNESQLISPLAFPAINLPITSILPPIL